MNIANGTIIDIFTDRRTTFVTVSYHCCPQTRREQTVRLVVGPRTIVLNANGNPIPPSSLRVGMRINAAASNATTRSIPPQANAFVIRIVRNQEQENVTTGEILDINRRNRSFSTIRDMDFNTVIRFNTDENTRFVDREGRPTEFSRLRTGMRVRIRHANFMTASIPPQTTAFEVRIL